MIVINSSALIHNYHKIKKISSGAKILAMIKADAYGHGAVKIARILAEHDPNIGGFGVACLSEAVKLRQAGITQKIVLMRGVYNLEELKLSHQLNLDLVIHHESQLELLKISTFLKIKNHFWLKINTGMNRLGFLPEQIPNIYKDILRVYPDNKIIFITHFSQSEQPRLQDRININNNFTLLQMQIFNQSIINLEGEKSLANSAAILNYSDSHQDWVRPGLMLYGVSPLADKTAAELDLQPVMTFQFELTSIRHQKRGDQIGYNNLYTCEEDMLVGIASGGYGDGYPRQIKPGTLVWINNACVPIIGCVSMDMLAIDLRKAGSAQIGDPVILWGENLPIEKTAHFADANPRDLLCGVRER